MSARPAKNLPAGLTTYDVLKSLALLLMIVDHIGYYFFPDDNVWRAFGRVCVPIWMFLIGYARSRKIDLPLIGGMLALIAADALVGRNVMPLNILATVIVLRLSLDPLMKRINGNDMALVVFTAAIFMLDPFFSFFWSYGSVAVIFGIAGHMARNGFGKNAYLTPVYGVLSVALFVLSQQQFFHFGPVLLTLETLGCLAVMGLLLVYLPRTDARIGRFVPAFAVPLLRVTGRHTLAIYVVHLLAFKAVTYYLCLCGDCTCKPFFHPLSLVS